MKPAPFEYFAPESLEAALDLAAEHGYDAKWLAGGQSLVPAMNFRLVQPSMLLDLNRLDDLDFVRETSDGGLAVGAMTRQRRVERAPIVARLSPLLAEAMPHVAHPQIRNRGTIGGSLVHADPASELPVVAMALDARLRVQDKEGERWVDAHDFFQGIFTVDLSPEELLVEITFPPWPERSGWSFQEVARRQGDYALVGAAAVVKLAEDGTFEEVRLVFLNVGDRPVVAGRASEILQGQAPSADVVEEAARVAAHEETDPVADIHASVGYQRHLAQVLARRTILEAAARVDVSTVQERQ